MIIAIILGVVVVRGWLIEGAIVEGMSMHPTLRDGERLVVLKCRYSPYILPSRGDIIIFNDPEGDGVDVKRVIALPGEVIAIRGTRVKVNGSPLDESYAQGRIPVNLVETVPEGRVWVMGDNRDSSTDSRNYGPIDLAAIRGRAVLVTWPPPPKRIPRIPDVYVENE
jgi:signal peptidase I